MRNPNYSYPAGSMRSVESGFYPVAGATMRDVWSLTSLTTESFMDWFKDQWMPLPVSDKNELRNLADKLWWDRFLKRRS